MHKVNFKDNWEIISILGIFWAIFFITYIIILFQQGQFIYPLDDCYIHMSISKNFSQYGIWGINSNEFSSTSSSILYTLILSLLFLIFGVFEMIPLIFNFIIASILLYLIYIILKKEKFPSYQIFLFLLAMVFFLPLSFIVFIGMEHTLHVLFSLLLIYYTSKTLSFEKSNKLNKINNEEKILLILAPLITMIRFEGMFQILIITALFFLRKRFIVSIIFGILGFLPILIFGIISINLGGFFLPNSVFIKANTNIFSLNFLWALLLNPILLSLLIYSFIILYYNGLKKRKIWNIPSIMSIIFICNTLLHLQFASTGIISFYLSRYNTYLVAMGLLMILFSIKDHLPAQLRLNDIKNIFEKLKIDFSDKQRKIIVIFILISLVPFFLREGFFLIFTPQASNNIYSQQYQMALFLHTYYNNDVIAANDIGAINYFSDIECIDLLGLGDNDIALAMNQGTYSNQTVYDITIERGCKIAIIYDYWLTSLIPWNWTKLGEWTITNNIVCGWHTVSFYAVFNLEESNLISNLQSFSPQLPQYVIQSGNYTI